MNQDTSFRIFRAPRTGKYLASFKRGWKSSWTHYQQHGAFRQFESFDAAYQFLLKKCQYNAAFLATHICGVDPDPEVQVDPDKDLFAALCDAAIAHKDSFVAQQMFYFLRGVLFQWTVEHGEKLMEIEELFMPDIHYLSRHNCLAE